ncbi:DUF484 family protein [Lacibacterium aquatile]|uniref:DUF484 family protein n=1 Tax=Lacibacterium aquatile TaxID=1168082 RepID=A0ABW5DZT0_9PROT
MERQGTGKPPKQGGTDEPLTPAAVAAYLRRHPDFLIEHPDLLGVLKPPPRQLGNGVVDLQALIVDRLRADVSRLKLTQRKLIATSRNNLVSQGRVHTAVISLIGARSFETFVQIITEELAPILDVDAVGFGVEASRPDEEPGVSATSSVMILAPGTVSELMGDEEILLRSDISGDVRIFGEAASGLVRSDALIRMKIGEGAPPALLALGARRPGIFHPGQGTELIAFLAQTIELTLRAWLDLPE